MFRSLTYKRDFFSAQKKIVNRNIKGNEKKSSFVVLFIFVISFYVYDSNERTINRYYLPLICLNSKETFDYSLLSSQIELNEED
jgi:hypothetical protein